MSEPLLSSEYLTTVVLVFLLKITCFLLAYFTVRMGYRLIAAGVKGEFKFSASCSGAKADLASVSPGLLFVLLGVALGGFAISVEKPVHHQIVAADAAAIPQGLDTLPAPPENLPTKSSKDRKAK
jgi:hypothetical protein